MSCLPEPSRKAAATALARRSPPKDASRARKPYRDGLGSFHGFPAWVGGSDLRYSQGKRTTSLPKGCQDHAEALACMTSVPSWRVAAGPHCQSPHHRLAQTSTYLLRDAVRQHRKPAGCSHASPPRKMPSGVKQKTAHPTLIRSVRAQPEPRGS